MKYFKFIVIAAPVVFITLIVMYFAVAFIFSEITLSTDQILETKYPTAYMLYEISGGGAKATGKLMYESAVRLYTLILSVITLELIYRKKYKIKDYTNEKN